MDLSISLYIRMDAPQMELDLLCEEVLVLSPLNVGSPPPGVNVNREQPGRLFYSAAAAPSREDLEAAVGILVEKEMNYMPQPGYVNYLLSNTLIYNARIKAIRWIVESQRRLNNVISFGSVFYAANYLDRFISLNKCHEWKYCMFELLSVACLDVASKFNEIYPPPPLHALQMEGLHHPFGSSVIERMEMKLLQTLGWKLLSATPYSYLQLMEWINMEDLRDELRTRATQKLLGALLDSRFLQFRPSFVAEAAVRCSLQEILPLQENNQCFYHFTALVPQDQKGDKIKCDDMMAKGLKEEAEISTATARNQCNGQLTDCPVLRLEQEQEADDDPKI